MFSKLFRKKERSAAQIEPYFYKDQMNFEWSSDSDGWVSPLPELAEQAEIYIGPKEGFSKPKDLSCKLMISVKSNINEINEKALNYLVLNSSDYVKSKYKHLATKQSYIPYAVELFEYGNKPDEYSITYNTTFDPDSIWRVRMKNGQPISWGFDD